MPSRPDLAPVVEQALANVSPGNVWSIKLDRVEPLDFDAAGKPSACNTKQFAGNLPERHPLYGSTRLLGSLRVAGKGLPVFGRKERCPGRIINGAGRLPTRQPLHLFIVGKRHDAG